MASIMQFEFNLPKNLYRAVLLKEHSKKVKALLEVQRLQQEQEKIRLEEEKARIFKMATGQYKRATFLNRKRELEEELENLKTLENKRR